MGKLERRCHSSGKLGRLNVPVWTQVSLEDRFTVTPGITFLLPLFIFLD